MDRTREAEQAVLGAMMLDPARSWAAVDGVLGAAHFLGADHRLIFSAMVSLRERDLPPDPVTVTDELGPQLEAAGGREYLAELVGDTPSAANVGAYARIVRESFDKRKIVDLGERLSARASNGVDAAEAASLAQRELEQIGRNLGGQVKPLPLVFASEWSDVEPAPRQWVLEGLIPAGCVTSLAGNGGLGKTLLALQIGLHVSTGRSLFGVKTIPGPVLGLFCEDDEPELNRRLRMACAAENMTLAEVDCFVPMSREGEDSVLCTFVNDHIELTPFYRQLEATIAAMRPWLVILDTAADLFAGDFISTPHVRQFLKIALGGLCKRYGCAILLLSHPSKAGQASGEGDGFSTAWNNSVRSRLYLRAPKPEGDEPADPEAIKDRRVLEVKKSNYGATGETIDLQYDRGCFVLDPEPIDRQLRKGVNGTRLAVAALDYLRKRAPLSILFREVFDVLQAQGDIAEGEYQQRRKPLYRAIDSLVEEGLVEHASTPRGAYRAVMELGTN